MQSVVDRRPLTAKTLVVSVSGGRGTLRCAVHKAQLSGAKRVRFEPRAQGRRDVNVRNGWLVEVDRQDWAWVSAAMRKGHRLGVQGTCAQTQSTDLMVSFRCYHFKLTGMAWPIKKRR